MEITPLIKIAARSSRATRAATLVRNQCDRVIGYHLTSTHDPARNGEYWLIDEWAPKVKTFVDVGANVGEWSARLLERAPGAHGVLVEPGVAAADRLREQFKSQDVADVALGAGEGEMTLFEQDDAGEMSSFFAEFSGKRLTERAVRVTTLDALADERGLGKIDLVKIDANGFDGRVIAGATRLLTEQRIGLLQFEYNQAWAAAGDTLRGTVSTLAEFSYETFLLRQGAIVPMDARAWGEFFAFANLVAMPRT